MEGCIYNRIVQEAYTNMLSSKKIRYDVPCADDIRHLKGILGKYNKRMEQITSSSCDRVSKEKLYKAKQNYINYYVISKRNPEIVSEFVRELMNRLYCAICEVEKGLLEKYALSNPSISGDEISYIMQQNDQYRKIELLTCESIIKAYVCRQRNEGKIINTRIITAFIDESLKLDELGTTSAICNFSYIICKGNLKKSTQLKNAEILESGLLNSSITNNMEYITLEGISYILNKIAFKYRYYGQVRIIIDNDQALKKWNQIKNEYRLVETFERVEVISVNRKYNKAADMLCRKNVVIRLKRKEYEELIRLKSATTSKLGVSLKRIVNAR